MTNNDTAPLADHGGEQTSTDVLSTLVVLLNLRNLVTEAIAEVALLALIETELTNAPPELGEIRDGFKFIGGKPHDPASWEKQ